MQISDVVILSWADEDVRGSSGCVDKAAVFRSLSSRDYAGVGRSVRVLSC